jgi:hypothetical protein
VLSNYAWSTTCSINNSGWPSPITVAYSTNSGSTRTNNGSTLSLGFTPRPDWTINIVMRISDTGWWPVNSNTFIIIKDTTAPTGTISVNWWAASTANAAVTLTLSASDTNSISQMQFSCNNSNRTTAETYATSKAFNITNQVNAWCTTTAGTKTVYVRYKDSAGNWSSAVSDTINYTPWCTTNTECSVGQLCVPTAGTCTWSATNPCDTLKPSAYMLNTNIKSIGCSIYSSWPPILDIWILENSVEMIALDWWTTNSNYWDNACNTYLNTTCGTFTNYAGSALHSKLIEPSTIDKRKRTDSCWSNTSVTPWLAYTNALKMIRCYYSSAPVNTCNTIASLNQCVSITGCRLSTPWTCTTQTCWTANGQSYSTLTSTSPNLCNIGSVTNFVTNPLNRTRSCGTASCSATKQAICGNGIKEWTEECDGGSRTCSISTAQWTQYCTSSCTRWTSCNITLCDTSSTNGTTPSSWIPKCLQSATVGNITTRYYPSWCVQDKTRTCTKWTYTNYWEFWFPWFGCYTNQAVDTCSSSTCFISGTQIKMGDWSYKNIEDIQIWEKILGQDDKINTVIAYDRPNLGERKLYSINNGPYFVTHEHPFMTLWWWKSISPEATRREMPNFEILPLKVGDILVKENGEFEYIWSIQSTTANPETPLYNFELDGNNTYYANGYLVHNKLYNWDSCTLSSQCACGSCVGWICCPTGGWCFKEWTQIRLPDGTTTAIENIQTGNNILWSENKQNKVLQLFKIWNNNWDLYAINNSDYFVTDTHPFMTTEGWKSLNPVWSTKENPGMVFWQLKIGDTLITEQGTNIIYSLEKTSYAWYVYNFRLDGNQTYYADWYLVHNVETKTVE